MPDLSTCGVRRCRFRDTSHANRNKVFDVRTPNVPVSSRVGQRYGRRTPSSYASSSDWWPGDILFLDWEARSRSTSSDGMQSVEEPHID